FPATRGFLVRELLNQSHTSKAHHSSVPYEPELRKCACRKVCASFGFLLGASKDAVGVRHPEAGRSMIEDRFFAGRQSMNGT
ncbi:MAG TPA: hypothetical protein VJ045_00530, partial [Hyphomicrobiaceae bacterium]|nr:hypothetical protein [Hyphomicrobiaceae bacterium]